MGFIYDILYVFDTLLTLAVKYYLIKLLYLVVVEARWPKRWI